MANANRPMGAITKGDPLRQNTYIAGGTINIGDLVTLNSAGQVVVATASQALLGASNAYVVSGQECQVWDHPDQLFIIQSDSADIDALTDMNLNYNIVAGSSPGARISGHVLDGDTGATTATLPLKLLELSKELGNGYGAYARCVVKINNHVLNGGTGTAGV